MFICESLKKITKKWRNEAKSKYTTLKCNVHIVNYCIASSITFDAHTQDTNSKVEHDKRKVKKTERRKNKQLSKVQCSTISSSYINIDDLVVDIIKKLFIH